MPSLSDTIANSKKLSSYTPVIAAPPVQSTIPQVQGPSTNLRFILPAFNSDPDTLRQFDNLSSSTKIRILPRPQPRGGKTIKITNASGTSTSTSGGSGGSGSGGSGGSGSGGSGADAILNPKTAVVTTGVLSLGMVAQTSIQMAQSEQLINMSANGPCEVRLYGTQTAQSFDASRPSGNPVQPEIAQNVITCVVLDTAPFLWPWQNRICANQDNPQTATIYVTVIGTNPLSGAPVTVTITYLPLEGTNV
jgi:hypothetical protein